MATFISQLNLTGKGIRSVEDPPDRFEASRAMAEKPGLKVKSACCAVGRCDVIVDLESSDEAVTSALLKLSAFGSVRSQTLRGFSVDELRKIIGKKQ